MNLKHRAILQAIADGKSYDQILHSDSTLSYADIFYAAAEALRVVDTQHSERTYTLADVRKLHARAYEKWDEKEDSKLLAMFRGGLEISQIADKLDRKPGAIRSRLEKLSMFSLLEGKPQSIKAETDHEKRLEKEEQE